MGAAATAGILLLPHAGHHTPAPSRGPASASTSGNQKAAPSTPAGGRSGSAKPYGSYFRLRISSVTCGTTLNRSPMTP